MDDLKTIRAELAHKQPAEVSPDGRAIRLAGRQYPLTADRVRIAQAAEVPLRVRRPEGVTARFAAWERDHYALGQLARVGVVLGLVLTLIAVVVGGGVLAVKILVGAVAGVTAGISGGLVLLFLGLVLLGLSRIPRRQKGCPGIVLHCGCGRH